MIKTVLLSLIMMTGLFIILLSAVGFVRNKKFFGSAPKEIQDVIKPRKENFKGQHAIGWCLMVLGLLLMGIPVLYGACEGIKLYYSFWQFFARFAAMFLLVKLFDIVVFDYILLCHSGFYPFFYPETKDVVGPHLFGYNKFSHLKEIIFMILGSALLAFICTRFVI